MFTLSAVLPNRLTPIRIQPKTRNDRICPQNQNRTYAVQLSLSLEGEG